MIILFRNPGGNRRTKLINSAHPVQQMSNQSVPFFRLGVVLAVVVVRDQLKFVIALVQLANTVYQVHAVALEGTVAAHHVPVDSSFSRQVRRVNPGGTGQKRYVQSLCLPGHHSEGSPFELLIQFFLSVFRRDRRMDEVGLGGVPDAGHAPIF
jgi:hypothetical protein